MIDLENDSLIYKNQLAPPSSSNLDTIFYCWETIGIKRIQSFTIDNNGDSTTDTISFTVIEDKPVIQWSGIDSIIYLSDSTVLNPTVSQMFGSIISYEWDMGNTETFLQTNSSSSPTIFIDSVQDKYECVLKVTDEDSNITTDTIQFKVLVKFEELSYPILLSDSLIVQQTICIENLLYIILSNKINDNLICKVLTSTDGNTFQILSDSLNFGNCNHVEFSKLNNIISGISYGTYLNSAYLWNGDSFNNLSLIDTLSPINFGLNFPKTLSFNQKIWSTFIDSIDSDKVYSSSDGITWNSENGKMNWHASNKDFFFSTDDEMFHFSSSNPFDLADPISKLSITNDFLNFENHIVPSTFFKVTNISKFNSSVILIGHLNWGPKDFNGKLYYLDKTNWRYNKLSDLEFINPYYPKVSYFKDNMFIFNRNKIYKGKI